MENEIWKDIPGWEGLYQASTFGRIKSNNTYHGRIGCIMKGFLLRTGYRGVIIQNKHYQIHRLIAITFIPNPDNKPCINHIDGNKLNNCLENLEWCTYSENRLHAIYVLGQKTHFHIYPPNKGKFGKDNRRSIKITQYRKDGEFIKNWSGIQDIARELLIDGGNISKCCNGKRLTAGRFIWKFTNYQ